MADDVKLVTWNVNSIRQRFERLVALLARHSPDVVCLQETKTSDADFPAEGLRAAGYASIHSGQKAYNGVAILAKGELADVARGFRDGGDDEQARLIAATIEGVRVICAYVPNGQSVGSEKYAYKLEWLERLRKMLDREGDAGRPLALAGDFNVAPTDADVHDPEAWRGQVLVSEPERAALRHVLDYGLVDAFRDRHPDKVAFTWWDYRQLGFPKNRGLRIDHILTRRWPRD
jgi:exodeoxyribonuclease-3